MRIVSPLEIIVSTFQINAVKDLINMIEVRNLTRKFGDFTAVNNISFTAPKGEVLGFLGPNGAGKSTTMKMITGFLQPTAGDASVCGFSISSNSIAAKKKIGYLPEGAPAYSDMTPKQFLGFIADIRNLGGNQKREAISAAIARTNINSVINQPIETLSKGYKRRVGLAQAILHNPEVLILDEPTDGLDPNQKHEVRKLIQEIASEKTIIVSTHILEEVSAICHRAVIIANGNIVADGSPHELEGRSRFAGAVTITMTNTSENSDIANELKAINKVDQVEIDPITSRITAFPAVGENIFPQVWSLVQLKEWQIKEIHHERGRFDDIFRSVTCEKEYSQEQGGEL